MAHRALRWLLASGLCRLAAASPALALDDPCQAPDAAAAACALSAVQQDAAAKQAPGECVEPFTIFVHHKSGTYLAMDAAWYMNEFLTASGCWPTVAYDWAREPVGSDPWTPQPGQRFVHLERDPFEMIVSGYKYHMATSEFWVLLPSRYCRDIWGSVGQVGPGTWAPYYLDALCSMWNSPLVTPPGLDEDFQTYLLRVDVDTGLLANALWNREAMFGRMEYMHDAAEARSDDRSENICLAEFETACNATWHQALGQVTGASGDALTRLTQAAAMSCPEYQTDDVASHEHQGELPEDLPSTLELMQRIRELDHQYLNSSNAALAAKLSCQGDPDYH